MAGENRSGIRSVPDIALELNAQAAKYDSARRCSLFSIEKTGETPAFNLDDWWRKYTLTLQLKRGYLGASGCIQSILRSGQSAVVRKYRYPNQRSGFRLWLWCCAQRMAC